MELIPEGWPPDSLSGDRQIVPLFPLANVFLFPGCIMPLQIFEPRFRQMVADLLDSQGRLVIGTVLEQHADELAGDPPVLPIAGLGEIGRHEKLDDGRYLVWLIGLSRVRIQEVSSDRLYRKVEIEILHEPAPAESGEQLDALRPKLKQAILRRVDRPKDQKRELSRKLSQKLPIGYMADLLLQSMQLPQSVMQGLYSELTPEVRAEGALEEHERRP